MESKRAGSAFGTLLRRHRLAAGLSQEVLAEQARMSANGIGALERGDRRYPYRETVMLLSKALGLNAAETTEFETAAVRPRQPRADVDRQGVSGDEPRAATNLPLQRTSLIGRDAAVGYLAGMLRHNRLVTVTGAGGVGKTRTALEVGEAHLENTKDEVWLVELAPVQESFLASAVAQVFRVQESANRPLLENLVANLKQKSLLLILDNCEHVITEAVTLTDALLRDCPNVRILTTSREPLRVAGEQTYRLPSLRIPTVKEIVGLTAGEAAQYPAVILFAERGQAIDREFALSDDNASIIAEICRRLDGIPLAIELAAARVNILSMRALSQKLDQRLQILASRDRTAPPRHQTMRALIDWSYNLLMPPEQRLFEYLSVFAGGCTLATAVAMYSDDSVNELCVMELLSSLVDKSLAVADPGGPETRYWLLESTRQYASEKRSEHGDGTAIARRHASAYLDLAERLDREFDVTADSLWFTLAEPELENWRVALDWTLAQRGDVVLGQRLTGALRNIWPEFALVEGRRFVTVASALVDASTPFGVVAQLKHAEAIIAQAFGELKTAVAAGKEALATFQELGDERSVLRTKRIIGVSFVLLGQASRGESLLIEALDTARYLGKDRTLAGILLALAFARSAGQDLAGARAFAAEAHSICVTMGFERAAAMVICNLAEIESRAGNAEAAITLAFEAIYTLRQLSQLFFVANSLNNVASYLIALARYNEARVFAREALTLSYERGWRATSALSVQNLTAAAMLQTAGTCEATCDKCASAAARLLGSVDATLNDLLEVARTHSEQEEYDRVLALLSDTLGEDKLAKLMLDGAAIAQNQVVEQALRLADDCCLLRKTEPFQEGARG
jgi:predicted ATPase